MKTNVSIEMDDDRRSWLANECDGRENKRLATRKEIAALVHRLLDAHFQDLELANEPDHNIERRPVNNNAHELEEALARMPTDRNPARTYLNMATLDYDPPPNCPDPDVYRNNESYRRGWHLLD